MKTLMVVVMLTSLSAFAQDLTNGAKVWKTVNCALCHGPKGMGKAAKITDIKALKAPRIAGLDQEYAIKQITMIQGKKRKSKHTAMMMTKVKKLTPKDIKDVAAYVAKMGDSYKSIYGDQYAK